jgi:hypothetical protein
MDADMDRTPHDPFPSDENLTIAKNMGDNWNKNIENPGDPLGQLIDKLYERFKRIPTVDEVMDFVNGDDWARLVIWNKEKVGPHTCKRSGTGPETKSPSRMLVSST